MKTLKIILCLTLLYSSGAKAREFRAISGEHADFSRIVLFFDEPTEWTFGRFPEGYILQYEGERAGVDLSEIFDRIPRTRVRKVESDHNENRIQFFLDCTCHADAFELRNGSVALDFKDGDAPSNSLFETTIDPRGTSSQAPDPLPAAENPIIEIFPTSSANDFRSTIVASMADALSSNIADRPLKIESAAEIGVENIVHNSDEPIKNAISTKTYEPYIGPQEENSVNCFADVLEKFEVQEGANYDRLLGLRSRMFDGNFVEDPEVIKLVAEQSIYLGLGAESLELISSRPEDFSSKELLLTISRLVDNLDAETSQSHSVFSGVESCDGPIQLWSFLARDETRQVEGFDLRQVLVHFQNLSPNLKKIFFSMVVSRLDPLENEDEIGFLYSSMADGVRDSHFTQYSMEEMGADYVSDAQLKISRRENGEEGDQATLILARRIIDRGEVSGEDFVADVEGRAFELRGSQIGHEFSNALMKLQAINGNFQAAFIILDDLHKQDATLAAHSSGKIVEMFVEESSNFDFVVLVEKWRGLLLEAQISDETWGKIFRRLERCGLPSYAAQLASVKYPYQPIALRVAAQARWYEGYRVDRDAIPDLLDTESEELFEMLSYENADLPESVMDDALQRPESILAQRMLWLAEPDIVAGLPDENRYTKSSQMLQNLSGPLIEPIGSRSSVSLRQLARTSEEVSERFEILADFIDLFPVGRH